MGRLGRWEGGGQVPLTGPVVALAGNYYDYYVIVLRSGDNMRGIPESALPSRPCQHCACIEDLPSS